jgi:crossover junction endodeoxyribonuclease RuvC
MGAARGAAVLAAAEHGMEIFEYAPKRVKQAVVGRGGADKQQVAFMMRALLELTETPPSDAADALAIGLAHFYAQDPGRVTSIKDKPVPL